jgi:hypothetical protein
MKEKRKKERRRGRRTADQFDSCENNDRDREIEKQMLRELEREAATAAALSFIG